MVTTAQMRAVLAVLDVDVETLVTVGDTDIERAELAAVLQSVARRALRASVTEAPLGECARAWSAAAVAATVSGNEMSEQVQFDAIWLRQQIAALAVRTAPAPTRALLTAAAQAIDAAAILTAIARSPTGYGSRDGWQAALADLACAFRAVTDEHNELTRPGPQI
ncbi:hypothetical protein BJY24_004929 [Nocardia transvalensis]|uniref:Uncharacterized protein n=1 Tax=Nocardia transvalensis TaxID=37333 RepID=A0A7W9PH79_9NOCA|nr:hypothetical protein [Nocardia transvalensis]MBB5916017.1 hypothetical protein [Nocardia transvalensis]